MSLKTVDFPMEKAAFDEKSDLSAAEVEEVVRSTGSVLTDGDVQVAALHYVDPSRFGDSLAAQALTASYGVKIVPENVSVHRARSGRRGGPGLCRGNHPLHRRSRHRSGPRRIRATPGEMRLAWPRRSPIG